MRSGHGGTRYPGSAAAAFTTQRRSAATMHSPTRITVLLPPTPPRTHAKPRFIRQDPLHQQQQLPARSRHILRAYAHTHQTRGHVSASAVVDSCLLPSSDEGSKGRRMHRSLNEGWGIGVQARRSWRRPSWVELGGLGCRHARSRSHLDASQRPNYPSFQGFSRGRSPPPPKPPGSRCA